MLRIVQEGVTNVLKHAGATRLRVCARPEGDWLLFDVEDDGRGMPPLAPDATSPTRGHRGLENMRARAKQLGGLLELRSNGGGTVLRLRVPIAPQLPTAEIYITPNGG